MKTVVLHDRYSNEPMAVRPEAITAIRKVKKIIEKNEINGNIRDEEEEFSIIIVYDVMLEVKESIGTVITKIKKAEDEGSSK
jgi:hypothetical protein